MKIHIHVDETVSAQPKAVLVINGQSLTLSSQELHELISDSMWAQSCLAKTQREYFQSLTD